MSTSLSAKDNSNGVLQELQPFWERLSSFKKADTMAAMAYAKAYLCERLNASNAYWMCSVRMGDKEDKLFGWRPIDVEYLRERPMKASIYARHQALVKAGKFDISIIKNVEGHGCFRVNIQSQSVGEIWYQSDFYQQLYKPQGIEDLLCMAAPVNDELECWLCFERSDLQQPRFNEEERNYLYLAGAPLTWLFKQMALAKGIMLVQKPLTASEKKVLRYLLMGDSEQAIADKTNLSPATVHTYATRIYRKYGVKGRTGLMAAWISY